ncbi:MAG: carbohydrate ABC transporter permease [Phycisphaerae bacterium]|nr:carbohydrate ABC transporter permease [Phycisphaerae bacterium]
MALVSVLWIAPLVWMVATSFKPQDEVTTGEFRLLPDEPSRMAQFGYENYYAGREHFVGADGIERAGYEGVLTSDNVHFILYLRNTLIVALLGVSGMVISSAIAAYGFSRVQWPGRNTVFMCVLATTMIPFPAIMIPSYFLFKSFGWIGTLAPLWVPALFGNAFNIFLLRQFFMQIPNELSEAARIDGLSHWGIFWRIILPLSRPALVVVALFHTMFVWNDFLGPLIYLNHQETFTLALGLQFYQAQHGGTPWNLLMAACTLVALPLLVLFVLSQRTFIEGIASTGIKG